jgi:hypothetical protein
VRELNQVELTAISGGFFRDILGSMYHVNAHPGPGGLYAPGGQLGSAFSAFNAFTQQTMGMSGMTALAASDGSYSPGEESSGSVMTIGTIGGNNFGPDGDMNYGEFLDWAVDNPFSYGQYVGEIVSHGVKGNLEAAPENSR